MVVSKLSGRASHPSPTQAIRAWTNS